MNVMRAMQIVDSPEEIEVRHNNVPVWIQHVNEAEETARVYTRAQPDDEQSVPVEELQEIGPQKR
ncbi:small acid-soluble spore protein H (minor) [Melghirimyces thermohalophilus]|uniref:Small acid-soluble spore protein H (Minor) n=1 Tax=Melghirimyces thermohalophilus TaxID=1236220 RepID=A0A1G6QB28_9BACL|nr:H-type small acid-soluble spore protein [Melghirimyces thermohalophilus]SDC89421.1 small acid-soluble spore protein H (minor) [Melghirimyces thermohalophilus]